MDKKERAAAESEILAKMQKMDSKKRAAFELKIIEMAENNKKDGLAFKLIEMTAIALKGLYGGTLPTRWKEHIKESFGLDKRGAPKAPETQAEKREIAIRANCYKFVLTARDSIEKAYKHQGLSTPFEKSYSEFVEGLADEFGYDRSDIFKIIKDYESDSHVGEELFYTMKKALTLVLQAPDLSAIDRENISTLLDKAEKIMGPKRTFEERVTKWLSAGEQLQLFTIKTQLPVLIKAVSGKNKKNQ